MDEEKTGWGLFGARRGRPANPAGNPLGEYLRSLREERGWTIRRLATEIGMPETSAGYLSQMETGSKVPSPEVAERLAERLGDRRGIFQLWSMTGRRSDLRRAAQARRELARLLDDRSLMHHDFFTPATMASLEPPTLTRRPTEEWQELPPATMTPDAPGASEALDEMARRLRRDQEDEPREPDASAEPAAEERAMHRLSRQEQFAADRAVRVPLLPEGMDPHDFRGGMRGEFEQIRLEPGALPAVRLERPFAYRLSTEGAHRVRHLVREGDIAVMTCETMPIVRQEIYGVRLGRGIVLSQIIWNGHELLVMPAPEDSDFIVIQADQRNLSSFVIARVATVVRGSGRRVRREEHDEP